MKCYGYPSGNASELVELAEVTVQTDAPMLRRIARFLNECADGIEANPEWEHEHFRDWSSLSAGECETDIIVSAKS